MLSLKLAVLTFFRGLAFKSDDAFDLVIP